ncbi:MAG: hypothetical protein ACN4GZ_18695 [Acidimicrobiales bacterium]
MFFLGVLVGLALSAVIGWYIARRQRTDVESLERKLSAEARKASALESELAAEKVARAQAVRDEKLRNSREFRQYKTLLRRADAALAQAKAERDQAHFEAA